MSDPYDITVTLTEEELAFRQAARDAGIPSLVVSMYAGALRKLADVPLATTGLRGRIHHPLHQAPH